jgi:teichuronic acid biosynthesis glycosyltransferase TuaC
MKVLGLSHLCLVPYEWPSGYGGKAFHKPVESLVQMGCDVKMVAPVPWSPLPLQYIKKSWKQYSEIGRREYIGNVDVFHPRFISFPKGLFLSFSGMLMYYGMRSLVNCIVTEFPFDIIHAHNVIPEGLAGLYLKSVYGKPLVVTARGTDIDIVSKQSTSCYKAMRRVFESSAAIVTPSPRLTKAVYKTFSVKARTICNGLDLNETYTVNREFELHCSLAGHVIILSASELTQSKGIDLNIYAIKDLLDQGRNIRYIVIGDGPYRKSLEDIVNKFGIKEYVVFTGKLEHHDVMGYMAACDIFSMPSWQETFGLVYLEAMAHGKPVIGCLGQGMDTIITENHVGLLAKPKDVKTLISALAHILDNPTEALEMGRRGRDLVKNNFTHSANALQTMQLYEDIMINTLHQ